MWIHPLLFVALFGISLAHIPLSFIYRRYVLRAQTNFKELEKLPPDVIDDLLILYWIYKPRPLKKVSS